MRKTILILCTILFLSATLSAVTFDYVSGEEGRRACLRLPRGAREVKALLYCHQNMTEEVLFRSDFLCKKMDSLGVAMAFIQGGSQNWDTSDGCQERFESIVSDFARATEHPDKHIKINATVTTDEFTVEPFFTDSTRTLPSDSHAAVRPRVTILSGPVIQTGDYTFCFDPDYFGFDPRRLWSGITLCLEASGDDTYKSAVQELNIRLKHD